MNFEDLEVWKKATQLSTDICRELMKLKDDGFRDQITRSSLSIPSNIAEGFERGSRKECVTFLNYARGSCGELRIQIHIGFQRGHIKQEKGERWNEGARRISSMLSSLIRTKKRFIAENN
jgi:four helix bundle protein